MNRNEINKAVEVAKKMKEIITHNKRITVGKAIGYNPADEPSHGGVLAAIEKNGGKITSQDMCLAQLQGEMYRVEYVLGDGQERVAYINSGRVDVDSFSEESLIFRLEDDPKEGVIALFEEARAKLHSGHDEIMEQLKALDHEVPRSFRRLIMHKPSREVAANLYRAGGKLSQQVFEPFRGTLAYPKSDKAALEFFEKQPQWLEHRDTIEAYMLVGQMVEEGLI